MRLLRKTTNFVAVILIIVSCTSQEDIDRYIGEYESDISGYIKLNAGFSYDEKRITGKEYFSIISDNGSSVLMLVDEQVVHGKVINKRIKFDTYTLVDEDEESGQKAYTTYFTEGKWKGDKFCYGTVINGTVVENKMILPIEGFIEGEAIKIK